MYIFISLLGLAIGFLLNEIIAKVLKKVSENSNIRGNILSVFVYTICFVTSYMFFGIGINFYKAAILAGLLTIISFVDLHTRIIPDYMVIAALIPGIIFSFLGSPSITDSLLGMLCGGGVMLLLALVPNSIGGGDIKLMFALGAFLGPGKTLYAILLSFVAASIIGLLLLMFKVCGRKDYIPFGPFLSLGSFISLMIFI